MPVRLICFGARPWGRRHLAGLFLLVLPTWCRASLVAGTGDTFNPFAGAARVFRWADTRWLQISPDDASGGLAQRAAVFALRDYGGRLFAGTDAGQVYVYGGGTQWLATGNGGNAIPPDAEVRVLAVYRGQLYAGTRPPGLYRYEANVDRWLAVPVRPFELTGIAALGAWTDPATGRNDLYLGDIFHDLIIRWDPCEPRTARELFIPAPTGSCVWDFQAYGGRFYGSSYHGRVFVRQPEPDATGVQWRNATAMNRGYGLQSWLEVFQGDLYLAADNVLERLRPETSRWDALDFEVVARLMSDSPGTEAILALTAADRLYLGTSGGRVFAYDGQNDPVPLGDRLPQVLSLADTDFFDSHARVQTFSQGLDAPVAEGSCLDYVIRYVLEGPSQSTVRIVEELPPSLRLQQADPPADAQQDGRVTWSLGRLGETPVSGEIRLRVEVSDAIEPGTPLPTRVQLLDGETVFWTFNQTVLYAVPRLYVDPNSPAASPDGLAWDTAFATLTEALERAGRYRIPAVWAKEGLYSLPEKQRSGQVSSAIEVPPGTQVVGGFRGQERTLAERDLGAAHTIIQDLRGGEHRIVVARGADVLDSDPCDADTVLDGLTLVGRRLGALGSGILAEADRLILRHCRIQDCGQGVFLADDRSLLAEDTRFRNNGVGISGFGARTEVLVRDSVFSENTLGAYLGEGLNAEFTGCDFRDNGRTGSSPAEFAGGLAASCGSLTLTDCRLYGNRARTGGGLFVRSAQAVPESVSLRRCSFVGNAATALPDDDDDRPLGRGGAVMVMGGRLDVNDCWFVDNRAETGGGGLCLWEGQGQIGRSIFAENRAAHFDPTVQSCGGGLLCEWNRGPVSVFRSVFYRNEGFFGGGVVTRANAEHATRVINSTFLGNGATDWAGGALSVANALRSPVVVGGRAELTNCILFGNTGQVDGSALEVYAEGDLTLAACATDRLWSVADFLWIETAAHRQPLGSVQVADPDGMLILYESPFFAGGETDYHIEPNQVPRDRGRAIAEPAAAWDPDGDHAPLAGAWDVGADEWDPDDGTGPAVHAGSLLVRLTTPAPRIRVFFRGARAGGTSPDELLVVPLASGTEPAARTRLEAPDSTLTWSVDATGTVSGTWLIDPLDESFPTGRYRVWLQSADGASAPLAVSSTFFVLGAPTLADL